MKDCRRDEVNSVACIIDTLNVGGAQTNAITYAGALRDRGIETVFVSSGGNLEEILRVGGFRTYRINLVWPFGALACAARLSRIINQHELCLVHSHTARSYIPGYLASWLSSKPYVISLHGRIEVLPQSFRASVKLREIVAKLLISRMRRRTTFIAVSQEVKDYAVRVLRVPQEALHVVPNAIATVDVTTFDRGDIQNRHISSAFLEEGLPEQTTAYTIAWIGRTSFDKMNSIRRSVDSIILLNKRGYDVRLKIVGSGPAFASLSELCRRRNTLLRKQVIECIGEVRDISGQVGRSHLVIASGRSAIEALSQGVCTLLLSETGYCPRLTNDNIESVASTNFSGRGLHGLPSVEKMCSDIECLLVDSECRERSAFVGKSYIDEHLSVEILSESLLRVYRRAASGELCKRNR